MKYDYSEKSEKVYRKTPQGLWSKAQIGTLKFRVDPKTIDDHLENQSQKTYEINLLSNDVENILIEQAFKVQKLMDARKSNEFMGG